MKTKNIVSTESEKPLKFVKKGKFIEKFDKFNFNI